MIKYGLNMHQLVRRVGIVALCNLNAYIQLQGSTHVQILILIIAHFHHIWRVSKENL